RGRPRDVAGNDEFRHSLARHARAGHGRALMALSLHALSPGLGHAWERASRRERAMIVAAAIVVALAVLWTWVWQPINADIARLQRDLPRAHSVLATARAQANARAALHRTSASAKSTDPRAAVERVLAERGLRPPVTALDVQEGRGRLPLAAGRSEALM